MVIQVGGSGLPTEGTTVLILEVLWVRPVDGVCLSNTSRKDLRSLPLGTEPYFLRLSSLSPLFSVLLTWVLFRCCGDRVLLVRFHTVTDSPPLVVPLPGGTSSRPPYPSLLHPRVDGRPPDRSDRSGRDYTQSGVLSESPPDHPSFPGAVTPTGKSQRGRGSHGVDLVRGTVVRGVVPTLPFGS